MCKCDRGFFVKCSMGRVPVFALAANGRLAVDTGGEFSCFTAYLFKFNEVIKNNKPVVLARIALRMKPYNMFSS